MSIVPYRGRRAKQPVQLICFFVASLVCGVAYPQSGGAPQDAPPVLDAQAAKQIRTLSHPVARIFPGTSNAVLALNAERNELQLIDIASGRIADTQRIEGRLSSLKSYFVGQDQWDFLYIQENLPENPVRFSLGIIKSQRDKYFSSINTFDSVPENVGRPGVLSLSRYSKMGEDILIWDRSRRQGGDSYSIGGFRERSKVFAKAYPYDLLDIGNSDYMLSLDPYEGLASLLHIREGYSEDDLFLKELRTENPDHYSSFSPDTAHRGTGAVVVANGEVGVLTVLSVISGYVPQIDRSAQISLRNLPAIAAGNRNVLLAANKDLSVIVVGAVGESQLSVFRMVGAALEALKPVELSFPIADIAVLPRPDPSSESEVFVFLSSDKRALQIEPNINDLLVSEKVDSHDAEELAFPNERWDPAATERLQRALTSLGFSVGTIDGISGRATMSAVRAFQFTRGLDVTGYPNHQTRAALNEAVNKLEPANRSFVFTSQVP